MRFTSICSQRLVAPLLGLLLTLPLAGCNPPSNQQGGSTVSDSGPVATVNGDKIGRADFDKQLELRQGPEVLNRLITEKLIEQEAAKQNVTLDPKELAARQDELHKDHRYEEEVRQGVDPKLLDDQIRISQLLKKLMLKEITEEQKLRFYDHYKDELTQVQVAQILVTDRKEAERIHEDLDKGADFAEQAKKYSKDPASKSQGGVINGYFVRGQLERPFQVAFELAPGHYSSVVQSQFGYHIIKVVDKKTTYDQLKSAVEDTLLAQDVKQYEDRLRAKSQITSIYDKDRTPASPAASTSPALVPSASTSP